jgi:hypothetical protein
MVTLESSAFPRLSTRYLQAQSDLCHNRQQWIFLPWPHWSYRHAFRHLSFLRHARRG